VQIEVFDVLGRRIVRLYDGVVAPERPLAVPLTTTGLASGVYFVRVTGETFVSTQRAAVVR
jgi:hypothetical protein